MKDIEKIDISFDMWSRKTKAQDNSGAFMAKNAIFCRSVTSG
jgi:hypothetical protein